MEVEAATRAHTPPTGLPAALYPTAGKGKRKAAEAGEDSGQGGKRARVQEEDEGGVVDLLDDSD